MTTVRLLRIAQIPASRAALSVGIGALAVAFGVALMATAGYLVSRAAEQPPILSLTVTIVAVRFFGLGRPLARYLDRLVGHDLALRALGTIRAGFYTRLEPLAPAQLTTYRRGDLLERMVGDIESLQGLYLRGLAPPLVALAVGAGAVGVTAAFLPMAAVVLAGGLLAAGVIVPLLSGALSRPAARRRRDAAGRLSAELVELLRGAPELVANGREADAERRVRSLDRELAGLARRDAFVGGLGEALSLATCGLTVVGVLAVAVAAHDAGALDRVLVATLALLALASFDAVLPLPSAARELTASLGAGQRLLELTDAEPDVRDPASPVDAPTAAPAVALEDVTVRYRGDEAPALRSVDLEVRAGRSVALVGPSGAGKTTISNLLFRFLDPDQGRVTIAGRDVREYRQEDVRSTFALAGQGAHVFASTIRENLRLARPGSGDAELWGALRRAHLADWVATLPHGLDTFVGEEGDELSGGQRQRLVLARALLADAPVLVLDEPTAHLDAPTAQAVMNDVLEASRGKAVLLITHRQEGLERMDEIVRLDGGRRVGHGGSPRTRQGPTPERERGA
jgi:thiol reductant ABC exporter CydC subunit